MKLTRSIPLLWPLLFAMACGPAKPASGPETTSSGSPGGDASSPPGGDATADADKPDPGNEEAKKDANDKEVNSPAPPPAHSAPQAATVEKPLSGGLSDEEINAIMTKNGALFDDCYKIGMDKSKQLIGKVEIKATIGPSGNVNEVKILSSTVKNPKVDTCVADAFRKIKFPPPSTGATSVITFPMKFEGVQMVKK